MLNRVIGYLAGRHTQRLFKRFEKKLTECQSVQNHLLLDILRANQAGDFGREHGFARIASYTDFQRAAPLGNYSYFEPYIQRCCAGRPDALFGPSQKILMFALTSGTTDRAKYIPITQSFARDYRRGWEIWGYRAIFDHPESFLRKILQVSSSAEEFRTEAGIPCGAISGFLARNQKRIVRRFYPTPYEVAEIKNAADRYYTIMRFAIAEDIGIISTANPSTILALAQTAVKNAEQLIRDIYDGTLDKSISLPRELRANLTQKLRANPQRAQELEGLLNRHGRLLPKHYWKVSFLGHWTGGTLRLYLPRLNEYFGPTPIRDIGLLASEGRISIPLKDNTPAGVLEITSNFYEFVPQEQIERLDNPSRADTLEGDFEVLTAWQLEKDKQYYIFLTNRAGLYRYNLGDLMRVTDYMGATPVIEFLSKGAHNSSITGEKLTENQVAEAVRSAADELAVELENFVIAPQWSDPPGYQLLVAIKGELPTNDLKRLVARVDQKLMVSNMEYESKRNSARLSGISARQVSAEFLTQRDEKLRQKNQGRSEQFKHRFLYNEPY